MNATEIHKLLVETFGPETITGLDDKARDPWIEVAPGEWARVAAFLKNDARLKFDHLNDLCGVDYFQPDPAKAKKFPHEPHVEVVCHLSSFELRHTLVVKIKVPRWQDGVEGRLPQVPTVSHIWDIADWHERECYDLVGVEFTGHPNLRRILCAEDWVGHPLRKDYDFPLEYHGVRGK